MRYLTKEEHLLMTHDNANRIRGAYFGLTFLFLLLVASHIRNGWKIARCHSEAREETISRDLQALHDIELLGEKVHQLESLAAASTDLHKLRGEVLEKLMGRVLLLNYPAFPKDVSRTFNVGHAPDSGKLRRFVEGDLILAGDMNELVDAIEELKKKPAPAPCHHSCWPINYCTHLTGNGSAGIPITVTTEGANLGKVETINLGSGMGISYSNGTATISVDPKAGDCTP